MGWQQGDKMSKEVVPRGPRSGMLAWIWNDGSSEAGDARRIARIAAPPRSKSSSVSGDRPC